MFCLLLVLIIGLAAGCRKNELKPVPLSRATTVSPLAERIGEPFGVAVNGGGIYVSDGESGKILKLGPDGRTTVVSDKFDTPSEIAVDRNGDLIVADSGTNTIKRLKRTGETETLAGVENQAGFQDGDARTALFNAPVGVAVAGDRIFVADTYNDRIRVIEAGRVTTLAGSVEGFADGQGAAARFDTPTGLVADPDGRLLVADTGNRRIRIVGPDGATQTLAGNGSSDLIDGPLAGAAFVQPAAVAVAPNGSIFIADGNALRVIENRPVPLIRTVNDGRRGFADGDMKSARFNRPSGLAFDQNGDLLVADSENGVVRSLTGADFGKALSPEEIEAATVKAPEFRQAAPARWPYDPPENRREIAGTLGEIRGEMKDAAGDQVWFHNGLDIVGGYGETARAVRTEKILRPVAVENFGTLRELVRFPQLGYIHLRLGRDQTEREFGDKRFLFAKDTAGKNIAVRIPRGAKFKAGEPLGTLNPMNHVHLIAGRSGGEMNALDALVLPGVSDKIAPVIEAVRLTDENWHEIETPPGSARITLNGKTRVVLKAYDRMDGNAERRRLGVFQIGYQILKDGGNPVSEPKWTIRFDRLPEPGAVRLVYAAGSKSGATGETIFNYIATNEVHGNVAREDFLDAAQLEKGDYVLRVFAADYSGNTASKDVAITVR
ncbi:MAG: hypothetical protein JSS81_29195 [Acidobacteria bacterium]|nr:hypothetical protein [Acidobacteriota bacterium]